MGMIHEKGKSLQRAPLTILLLFYESENCQSQKKFHEEITQKTS